jgi:outer membrane protein OmpA-like peptidoglycan-associated protein
MHAPRGTSIVLFVVCLLVPTTFVASWLHSAGESLASSGPGAAANVPVASASEDDYCSPKLKQVLRRVAGACGLIDGSGGRGCKPADAKTVAAMSGSDFNALFRPLSHRARIIQFDAESSVLDTQAQQLAEEAWSEKRGASFFFVVARASSDGGTVGNQSLSQERAEAVLKHLQTRFNDPDITSELGLLWLGEEYAQLSNDFCSWKRSRGDHCSDKDINRSAFVAWIDCSI